MFLELVDWMGYDTPEEWFKLAFDAEDPEEKIEYFTLILECDHLDPELWSNEAMALVWNNKGIALSFLGRDDEALECFKRSVSLNKNDVDVWCNMGVILFNIGRYEEAIKCYNRILGIDPCNDNAWINKGDILGMMGKHNEAIECYSKVHKEIELDNKFAVVWNKKGLAYYGLGKYEDAAECFTRVLKIDPEHVDAIENLKVAMAKTRRMNEDMKYPGTSCL
ncbi:tetratricopeptide repeat protein [Methanolobus sp. WCC5]|uniref:tetratricopeptide repeat protein n=1 Tax=Methanolobus sp. WCC5 TaxID=3125785 RepID=UPI0032535A20